MGRRCRRGLLDGATRQTRSRMRKDPAQAEKLLWAPLRRQALGVKFRRQYPRLVLFPDFCCVERRLIIEVDGASHAERADYDAWRNEKLQQLGFRVMRFFNDEVRSKLEGVVQAIYQALAESTGTPSPNPPPCEAMGEGIRVHLPMPSSLI